jgi:hypothetical protein
MNVKSDHYWSSTTDAEITSRAWYVYFGSGYKGFHDKSYYYFYVWCVRDIFWEDNFERARYEHLPICRKPMDLTIFIPETRPHPSYPPLYVLPEPGGIKRFPWPLLIKPDRTFNKIIQGLLGDGKPFRAEVIAKEIKSPLGPGGQGLMLDYL